MWMLPRLLLRLLLWFVVVVVVVVAVVAVVFFCVGETERRLGLTGSYRTKHNNGCTEASAQNPKPLGLLPNSHSATTVALRFLPVGQHFGPEHLPDGLRRQQWKRRPRPLAKPCSPTPSGQKPKDGYTSAPAPSILLTRRVVCLRRQPRRRRPLAKPCTPTEEASQQQQQPGRQEPLPHDLTVTDRGRPGSHPGRPREAFRPPLHRSTSRRNS